jgi:hypothetical protein
MSAAPHHPSESTLQKERRLFRELRDRLLNAMLNWLFDLRPDHAVRRMRNLVVMFLLTGFLICLIYYPLRLWAGHIQEMFLYLLNPAYARLYPGEPFSKFFAFAYGALSDPEVFQYFPIFLAPFFIALQLASFYLADIFELEDMAIARKFVWEVAFSGSDETLRISQGRVNDQNLESSNYLIGGPGKVIVDLDSIALFERADGTPQVIGPTGKEPRGKATIDGFERFRQAVDIRDQYVDISVTSRSLDGIPITATDVRLMFSIDRGANPQPTPEFPYPFDPGAIEKIVYKSTSKVTPDQNYPSNYEFSWFNNMISLIRARLGGFMAERNLAEYLAGIGRPEIEKSKEREELIANDVRRLAQPPEEGNGKEPKAPPEFTPRYKITSLFSQFAEEFTRDARNRGVVLHWIGVGTWKSALEEDVVTEKHLQAWLTSQENARKGSSEALKKAETEAMLEKMETLIRGIPIDAYYEITGEKKHFGKKPAKKTGHKAKDELEDEDGLISEEELLKLFTGGTLSISDIAKRLNQRVEAEAEKMYRESEKGGDKRLEVRSLLLQYRNQFIEAVRFMEAKNEPVPESIREAIKYINQQMGFKHWAGLS